MRFLLAIWVILHHLTGRRQLLEAWTNSLPAPFQNIIHHGYLAVGTFFVLSGFVLARAYAGVEWNRAALVRYAWARVARVYPVYVLSLALIAPFAYYDLFTPGRVAASARPYLIANYGFVLQGWSGTLPVNWNTPAWSLSCELFFYACFPLAVIALERTGRRGVWIAAIAAFSAPIWRAYIGMPDSIKPLIHLADFVAGIAAARVFARMTAASRWAGRGYWLYLPAAVFMAFVAMQPGWGWGRADFNSVVRPANAALLVGLAVGGGVAFRALSARAAVFLGQASYSMYILHIPILWWLRRYGLGYLPGGAAAALYIGSVVTTSGAVYRWFEEPANRRIRSWLTAATER